MKMYQPAHAHLAFGIAMAFAAVVALSYLLTLLPSRRRQRPIDPATIRKNLSNLRWAYVIAIPALGQLIALNYSQAYDLPHQPSTRTWIAACCGLLAPSLGFVRMWLDKEPKKPQPTEPKKPYYRRD